MSRFLQAILGFRETEKKHWNAKNTAILDRLRQHSFAKDSNHLPLVHVLDLSEQGHIKPHIDSARVSYLFNGWVHF